MPFCIVSFIDTELISHSIEIEARSLCEAGALALAEFRSSGVIEHIGPAIRFQIEVRRPATRHEITVSKIEAWVESSSKSLSEQAVKASMRDQLK